MIILLFSGINPDNTYWWCLSIHVILIQQYCFKMRNILNLFILFIENAIRRSLKIEWVSTSDRGAKLKAWGSHYEAASRDGGKKRTASSGWTTQKGTCSFPLTIVTNSRRKRNAAAREVMVSSFVILQIIWISKYISQSQAIDRGY